MKNTLQTLIGSTLLSMALLASAQTPDAQIEPNPSPPTLESQILYRIMVGEISGRRGDLGQAVNSYLAAANASDDPAIAERALAFALYAKNDDAAHSAARRWLTLAPDALEANQAMAALLLRADPLDADAAVEQLDRLRELASGDGQEGIATVAAVLSQVGDKERVLSVIERLRKRQPDNRFAQYYYALTAMSMDKTDSAQEALDQALTIDPDWAPAILLRTQALAEAGQVDEAIDYLTAEAQRLPDDGELRLGLARLLAGESRYAEAQAAFERLLATNPDDPELLFALGVINLEQDALDVAEQYFLQVLRNGDRSTEAYLQLGRIGEERGNYAAARDWYERVPQGERQVPSRVRAAITYGLDGDVEAMRRAFERLRERFPDQATGLLVAEAEAFRELDDNQAAFAILNAAVEQYPEDTDLRYSRALAAERVDQLTLLETDLRQLIEADPENAHALNALGYTLADRTTRFMEAKALIERALALLPQDAAVLDSMGWVHYRLGDLDMALEYLDKAYRQARDGEIAAHLVEVLWEQGDKERARSVFDEALDRLPDDEHLEEIQGRLGL